MAIPAIVGYFGLDGLGHLVFYFFPNVAHLNFIFSSAHYSTLFYPSQPIVSSPNIVDHFQHGPHFPAHIIVGSSNPAGPGKYNKKGKKY